MACGRDSSSRTTSELANLANEPPAVSVDPKLREALASTQSCGYRMGLRREGLTRPLRTLPPLLATRDSLPHLDFDRLWLDFLGLGHGQV